MRELRLQEIEEVSGGSWYDPIIDFAGLGSSGGAVYGAAKWGTTARIGYGAARGGVYGACFGAGYALGTLLYENVPQLHYEYWTD